MGEVGRSPACRPGLLPRPHLQTKQSETSGRSARPVTYTPSPQSRAFPPPPPPPLGLLWSSSAKLGPEWGREVRQQRVYEGVTHSSQACRTPPLAELPPRTSPSPALQGSLLRDKAATASSPAPGALSPALLRVPGRDSVPKGLGSARGTERSPGPAPPPQLTCSALCRSSGARRPGRRQRGFRRRRCPQPAGSRWWSPHGSAGPAAAAAAAAAAALGGSSWRRRRRGGDQKAAGRIVRRLRARERAEDPARRPRPGEAVLLAKRRGGEAPAATAAAATQPATHSSPVPDHAPPRRRCRRRLPPGLFSSRVPKSWHAPRSGCEGCRAGAPSGPSARETLTKRKDGAPGFPFSPSA